MLEFELWILDFELWILIKFCGMQRVRGAKGADTLAERFAKRHWSVMESTVLIVKSSALPHLL